MNYDQKTTLSMLNNNEFKKEIYSLTQEEKDEMLYFIIDSLKPIEKLNFLLENGADASQLVGEEQIMLWTIAFSRDTLNKESPLYLTQLVKYIFNNFSEEFQLKSEEIIQSALRNYKAIINKSNMAYNTLGNENEIIQNKLDNEYSKLLDGLADNLENLDIEIKNKNKKLRLVK